MHSPLPRGLLPPTMVLLGLLLSGCTMTSQGQPAPSQQDTTPDSTGSATSTSRDTAPTLEAKPLTVPEGSPCKLLTQQQWADSIYAPFKPENSSIPGGRVCKRQKLEANNSIEITIQRSETGLQAIYSKRTRFEVFNSVSLNGYPAVLSQFLKEGSECGALVLVRPKTVIGVSTETSTPSKRGTTCNSAEKYATLVVKNLKAKG